MEDLLLREHHIHGSTNFPVPSLPPPPDAQAQTMDLTWELFPGIVGTENNFAVGCLFTQRRVEVFDSQYKSIEDKMPGYWDSFGGQLVLRRFASRTIEVGYMDIAKHLCGTRNVPANPIPLSAAQLARISGETESNNKFNIMPTPLHTALKWMNQDLASTCCLCHKITL